VSDSRPWLSTQLQVASPVFLGGMLLPENPLRWQKVPHRSPSEAGPAAQALPQSNGQKNAPDGAFFLSKPYFVITRAISRILLE
jgi:hypothetical protein